MTPNTAKARNTLPNEGGNALLGHILCVDDEKQILTSLMRVFRRSGHKVSIATSGTEGLELLANTPVDIVISDMRMSGMDGDAFLTEVARRWPQTVRMLLTGYSDMESTLGAINDGSIYRYIAKPWDDTDLLVTIKRAMELKRLYEENEFLKAQNKELLQQIKAA